MDKEITPENLRDIADVLEPHTEGRGSRKYYICLEATDLHVPTSVLQELLRHGGLTDLTGAMGYRGPEGFDRDGYERNAMNERFMYLEFLALYLESESVL